jgi:hypothetical protein
MERLVGDPAGEEARSGARVRALTQSWRLGGEEIEHRHVEFHFFTSIWFA